MEKKFVLPHKSIFSQPIILKRDKETIEYDGILLFMVKPNKTDPDEEAIISKTIEIIHTNGDPYHGILEFTLEDTSHPEGKYFFGFKTGIDGEWLPTKTSVLEITNAIVQGQTA